MKHFKTAHASLEDFKDTWTKKMKLKKTNKKLMIAIGVLVAIISAVAIILAIKYAKSQDEYYDEDFDFEDDDFDMLEDDVLYAKESDFQ